jgi:DNA-binding LacI/PurR family transcriptional regulator
MGLPGKTPAIGQAFNFLKAKLAAGEWNEGECLPSMRTLAQKIGVSKPTVIKTIELLKEEKLVSGRERQRVRAGISASPFPANKKSWQIKRSVIEKDIVSGVFGYRGSLPSIKELHVRYGYCFTTLKKILRAMTVDGIIALKGKGYAMSELPEKTFQKRMVFITILGHFSQSSALNQEHNRIVNMFENECKRLGLQLEIIEIDFYDIVTTHRAIAQFSNADSILGYLVDGWVYLQENVQRSYRALLLHLARLKKPVALLDEIGDFTIPVELQTNPLVQVFRVEGKQAGERIARFLAGLGHTRVVYLSYAHFAQWSIDRFEGVATQFSRMGMAGKACLVSKTYNISMEQILEASGLTDSEVRTIISTGRTPSQAKDLEQEWLKVKRGDRKGIAGTVFLNGKLKRRFSLLSTILRNKPEPEVLTALCNAALDTIGLRVFEKELESLFNRALAQKEATAWVCANDRIALHSLRFLHDHGIRVPAEISVVGFDNIPVKALEQRLTTMDFNPMGFIHQMVNFILRPPKPRGPYRHKTIEVAGILLERDTTGPAKGAIRNRFAKNPG